MSPKSSGSPLGPAPGALRIAAWTGAGVLAAVLVAMAVALAFASRPEFLGGYHSFERNRATVGSSVHREARCEQCHVDPRGPAARQVALIGDFYRGLYKRPDKPLFVRLPKPTNDACLEYHRADWSDEASRTMKIPHPAHLRVASETRECVECHKWTAHEEDYVERHKEMPFSTVCGSFGCHAGSKTVEQCGDCHHSLREDKGEWKLIHEQTVRAAGPNGCLEACHEADQCRMCHTTGKRPDFKEASVTAGVKAIEREHVKPDWMAKHGGTALADDSKCFQCHVSKGECEDCHAIRPEFHGPKKTWLHQHKEFAGDTKDGKTVANAQKEKRCLACHEKAWCEECHDQFKEMR